MIIKFFKQFKNKYFGTIEYLCTIVNVDGSVKKIIFSDEQSLNEQIKLINLERYYFVQKVEKFRRLSYKTNLEIFHTPLFFCLDNVTEKNDNFSYLLIDESLTNVVRCKTKPALVIKETLGNIDETFLKRKQIILK